MNYKTRSVLEHMLEDALDALKFAQQIRSVEALSKDRLYRKAIVMSILNIGELTKRLPQDFRVKHSEIPWKRISGMRDVAAHGYHIMDNEDIWEVVTNSLPDLVLFLQDVLADDTINKKEL